MAAGGLDALKNHIDRYICSANDAICFKMIQDTSDFENEKKTFHPDMSHQIFGEKEQIFGYADLRIDLFYSATQLFGYLGMKYSEKIDPEKFGVEVDNINKKMEEVLLPGCCQSLDEYSSHLQKDSDFHPHGEMVYQYNRTCKDGTEKVFEMFHPSIEDPGFREYHGRMQTFLYWFVDAASYIDIDDEKWEYYTIFEKRSGNCGKCTYLFVGYCTVYNFYAYPEHIRPRISQFLILPPYQRQGHATEILDAIQKLFLTRENIRDICVEDPSENFQRIRDFIDCRNCIDFDCFQPEKLPNGFSKCMFEECNKKLKLNARQTRRIYEILRLKNTDILNENSLQPYRLEVKRRLNQPFTAKQYGKKLDSSIMPSNDERFNILESEFSRLLEEYLPVVERLNKNAM
uniref:histone acetyltransferase type B catalytic subunit-like n=1 Tax=Styela clava TaxID=7725 RepID=UPI00193ABF8B|nr:histone acetyltransferase type B catalytic subunit-like [Styela clava]